MSAFFCRSRSALALIASIAFLVLQARGQQTPALQKGFSPEKLYQFADVDAINTFNGNLTARIPLGPAYPINGGMSYQLSLTYNSKIWDYEEVAATSIMTIPSRRSNAGLGWLLSLGRIITYANSTNTSLDDVYESPDGAEHVVHGGGVTQDGTYIRRVNNSNGRTVLEFPDGTIKTFDSASGDFLSARDSFGNGFDVTTPLNVAETPCIDTANFAQAWKITDTSGARTTYVCFSSTNAYPNATYRGMVDRVILVAPPDANGTSQQAVYLFAYSDSPNVCRGPGNTYLNAPTSYQVPLLTSVTQPDGSKYDFGYPQANTQYPFCRDGELSSIGLPTGATISYDYRGYQIPVDKCNGNGSPAWNSWVIGVRTRTISGPRIPTAVWTYDSGLSTTDAQISCLTSHELPVLKRAPAEQMAVTVTDPLGNVNENYYSVWPVLDSERIFDMSGQIMKDANGDNIVGSPNGFRRVEYGFPITHLTSNGGRLLSQRVYDGPGYAATPRTAKRSFYRTYEHDNVDCGDDQTPQQVANCANSNARVQQDRTVYEDDNNKIADIDSSDFDGLGHYRTVTLGGTFAAGNATIVSAFNKRDPDVNPSSGINSGTYPTSFTPPAATDAWLIAMPWSITRTENGVTSREERCFSPTTGFLRASRIRTTTASRLTSDLLTLYTPDAYGNVASEASLGGDIKNNASDTDLCSIADSAPTDFEYKLSHTYTNGVRATSQYSGATFLSLDRTIDPATGFVTSERDPAEQKTDYNYDSAFRLLNVTPTGRAATNYHYFPASGLGSTFTPARVELKVVSANSNTTSGEVTSGTVERHYLYDSLGRLWREKIRLPNDDWSVRDVLYNSLGWEESVSEQEKLVPPTGGSELDFVPIHVTTFSNYDPFGRAGAISLADGHKTTLQYTGVGSLRRTTKIATSASAEADALTTETYDRQGRLSQITESPGGADINTAYTYDPGGRLASVSMSAAGYSNQNRFFNYDGRGLLLSEQHPEKGGAAGNGQVLYGYQDSQGFHPQYDSHGHALRRIDGPSDLTYSYDFAERLRSVNEIDPASTTTPKGRRVLKEFTYGSANSGSDLQKGKLLTASRVNHLIDGRAVKATETYAYHGPGGAVSQRDTALTIDGAPFQTFSESFKYDDLGAMARLTYPTCLIVCGAATGSIDTVERHFTNGALTAVTNYATVGYNPNGTVGSVVHATGVTDTIAQDDNSMPRPKEIKYDGFSDCSVPGAPAITPLAATICAGDSSGASVQGQQGLQYQWTIEGGVITSPVTGTSITFTASSSTQILLHVIASNSCGPSSPSMVPVTVGAATTISQQPQSTTVASGTAATLHVQADGVGLAYQWYRGNAGDVTNPLAQQTARDFTTPALTQSTTYWVRVTGQCGMVNSASATVSINNLPAPDNVRAISQQGSTNVIAITWSAVSGASGYAVEWSTNVQGTFSPVDPAHPTTPSTQLTIAHVVSATSYPVAYIYRVRTVDSSGNPSAQVSRLDYALAAARLFSIANANDEPIHKGLTRVRGTDIAELRSAIDALRAAANTTTAPLPPVWNGTQAPTGIIMADTFVALQAPLNQALAVFGYSPFAYIGVAPPTRCVSGQPPCVNILSEHVQQLRDTLRNALR